MEVSDKLIGVALEAYDSKAGYSKIEKMRAALEAALSAQVQDVVEDRPMKVVRHLAEWWDTSDAKNVLGGAPWCVFEAKRILSADHGEKE